MRKINYKDENNFVSEIVKERRNKKQNMLKDYKNLMSNDGAVQTKVFETLAQHYGYKNGNSVRTVVLRWLNEEKEEV